MLLPVLLLLIKSKQTHSTIKGCRPCRRNGLDRISRHFLPACIESTCAHHAPVTLSGNDSGTSLHYIRGYRICVYSFRCGCWVGCCSCCCRSFGTGRRNDDSLVEVIVYLYKALKIICVRKTSALTHTHTSLVSGNALMLLLGPPLCSGHGAKAGVFLMEPRINHRIICTMRCCCFSFASK